MNDVFRQIRHCGRWERGRKLAIREAIRVMLPLVRIAGCYIILILPMEHAGSGALCLQAGSLQPKSDRSHALIFSRRSKAWWSNQPDQSQQSEPRWMR